MSKMQQLNAKKSSTVLCSLTCLLLLILVTFRKNLFFDNAPYYWLAGIILFLFIYELRSIIVVNKKITLISPKQIVSLYILLKSIKIFVFLAILIIYTLVVKTEVKRFILIAILLYFVYLLFDTIFLTSMEKKIKKI
jgi:hypothetical protein